MAFGIPYGTTGAFSWSEVTWISVSAICLSVAALLIYKAVRADPKNEPHFHEHLDERFLAVANRFCSLW